MKTITTALSLLLLAGPSTAGTFDAGGPASAAIPVTRMLSCHLMKTSFKGDNEGWLSSAEGCGLEVMSFLGVLCKPL
jgi:hypothetical protein